MKIKYIILVLVYRNTKDLIPFFESLRRNISYPYKIIVVESFYNDDVHNKLVDLKISYNFDLVMTENKGYGSGNNIGIRYALENYQFDYLILSNSDLIIKNFFNLDEHFINYPNSILGPVITTKKGKNQNPFIPFRLKFLINAYNLSFYNSDKLLFTFTIILNKLLRIFFLTKMFLTKKKVLNTYSIHGSFIVFPKSFLQLQSEIFNSKVFLYFEELHLAELARLKNYKIFVSKRMNILHFEDGSTFNQKNTFNIQRKSFQTFYNSWFK
jgi:GT2 family glycosyltransferase